MCDADFDSQLKLIQIIIIIISNDVSNLANWKLWPLEREVNLNAGL